MNFSNKVRVFMFVVAFCVVQQPVSCCHHDGCERISHSLNFNAVQVNGSNIIYKNFTAPVNITAYDTSASGHEANASFFAAFPNYFNKTHCVIVRAFENDCLSSNQCPNRKIKLSQGGGKNSITFILRNLTVSQDGTRVDICAHCGGSYVCFSPVYLTVKGPPINLSNYVSVEVTPHGIVIIGIIDTDTELLIIIRNTNNETVYEKTVHNLPFVVSGNKIGSNFDPATNYTVLITGKNPAGTGETLKHDVSFKNFISFDVNTVNLRMVNDHIVIIINLTFNRSRPVSIPRQIKVESDCIHKGHKNFILNKSDNIRIRLLRGVKDCVFNLTSGAKQKSINISVQIIQNVSISSCDGGYFKINAKLLPGATGIVMRVFDSQKNLSFSQNITSDDEGLIVANSSNKLEPGNYTVEIAYLNRDETIDNSSTSYWYLNLSCNNTNDILSTTPPPPPNTTTQNMTLIVAACVIAAIVAIIAIIIVVAVLIAKKCKKDKYPVSDKRVAFSAVEDPKVIIEGSKDKTSETEGDVPRHSVPETNTESHPGDQPYPPLNYPKPENPPAPDTPTNTDASTKPLLSKDGGSTMASSTMTSQQSASTLEKQLLIPNSKTDEKAKFVTSEIKLPPQLHQQKEPENSLQNPPSRSTVLIPKAPTNNHSKEKTVTLAPPVSQVGPPPNSQDQEIAQDSGDGQLSYIKSGATGSSTTYCSLAAGNKSGGEKKGQ